MKRSLKFTAAAAAILLAGTAMAAAPKARPHAAAATAGLGGHPNLNGIWQVMSAANFNLEPH